MPEKVKAIQQWPQPRTIRALRGFLKLVGFYRRFIKGYATLATPLTKLLTCDQLVWSSEADLAFQSLKDTISNTPVLVLPNFNIPFVVEIEASGSRMGAVLSQDGHPSLSSTSSSVLSYCIPRPMFENSPLSRRPSRGGASAC